MAESKGYTRKYKDIKKLPPWIARDEYQKLFKKLHTALVESDGAVSEIRKQIAARIAPEEIQRLQANIIPTWKKRRALQLEKTVVTYLRQVAEHMEQDAAMFMEANSQKRQDLGNEVMKICRLKKAPGRPAQSAARALSAAMESLETEAERQVIELLAEKWRKENHDTKEA